jgi:hypothetical protein
VANGLSTESAIAIVCDSASHARGKVATVATCHRVNGGSGYWIITGAARGRQYAKHKTQRSADAQSEAEDDPIHRCKLCGEGLPPLSECKSVLLPILNYAEEQGLSQITLSQLRSGSI